ncbi:MAG: hypothetical protein MRJ66_10585 [Nitrospira sp.]|nr:hypothetical protein [Nitrospira sp.]
MRHSRFSVGCIWFLAMPIPILVPVLAGIILVVVPTSGRSVQPEPDKGTWRKAAPMATKRTEVVAAILEGKIYVVCGFEKPSLGNVLNFGITPSVEMYDPATD